MIVLAYKKGKFSVEESEAIAAFAEEFKRLHRIDAHKFADIVVSLGKKPDYPRFWNDIGTSTSDDADIVADSDLYGRGGLIRAMSHQRTHEVKSETVADATALVVPGRPVRFVQKYVKRVFDPRARQGPWQQDEDKALEQYVPPSSSHSPHCSLLAH